MKLFEWADKEDRASKFGKNVVKAFYTAGNLFDIMQVFGELTPEITHARKYCKWKAAYIHNCLKKGEIPIPGPVGGDEENKNEESGDAEVEGASGGGWTQPPQVPSQPPQNTPQVPERPQPPPTVATSGLSDNPTTDVIEPEKVTKVQKLCKFASSALDYDDVDTAIKNLTEALDILHKSKTH